MNHPPPHATVYDRKTACCFDSIVNPPQSDASEAEKERIIRAKVVLEQGGKPSRAQMRIQATRGMTGGKKNKVLKTAAELDKLVGLG